MEVNQDISKWKHIRVLVIANKYYLVLEETKKLQPKMTQQEPSFFLFKS